MQECCPFEVLRLVLALCGVYKKRQPNTCIENATVIRLIVNLKCIWLTLTCADWLKMGQLMKIPKIAAMGKIEFVDHLIL